MITPIGKRVLVKTDKDEMVGGLYIPESSKKKKGEGVVVRVGTGNEISVGDHVIFDYRIGKELVDEDSGESFQLIREEDIFGVIV